MDFLKQYNSLAEKYGEMVNQVERKLLRLSVFRLITFFGGLVAIYLGFLWSVWAGVIITILLVSLFVVLLKLFSENTAVREKLGNLEKININEAKAVVGDYSSFDNGQEYVEPNHDFTHDIDVFGEGSLFQYLNRTVTGSGKDTLAYWLSDPYKQSFDLEQRQLTVKELADKFEWRQEFMAQGIGRSLGHSEIDGIIQWLKDDGTKGLSKHQKVLSFLLPCVAILMIVLLSLGVIHYSLLVTIVIVNLCVVYSNIKNTNKIHDNLSGRYRFLESLGGMLNLVEQEKIEVLVNKGKDNSIADSVASSGVVALERLSKILHQFDNRMNLLVNVIFNGLLLWDFHCLSQLEKWKREYSESFPCWLRLIGKVDAFVSLANYAYNNQVFIYPSLSSEDEYFVAKSLGHPLINSASRVCNDFSINKKGSICIVTGANMAGKSTLLRTIAVNYILAMIGVPVCAIALRFKPVRLFTSMRTTDSLHSNESYFYAELKRLKILNEKLQNSGNIFFILDEILKGTNSDDKRMGSILFLKKIISLKGTGMIATHDTSIGEMIEEYPDEIFNKCIEIEVDGTTIKFDYKLKDGIAKNKNAVILMNQMGLLDQAIG